MSGYFNRFGFIGGVQGPMGPMGPRGNGFNIDQNGNFDITNKKLVNVNTPTDNNDVTTKNYVDSNFINKNIISNKGDLISFSNNMTKLPLGSDNQFLSVDSSTDTGLRWKTISPSGTTTLQDAYINGNSINVNINDPITFKANDNGNILLLKNQSNNNIFSINNSGETKCSRLYITDSSFNNAYSLRYDSSAQRLEVWNHVTTYQPLAMGEGYIIMGGRPNHPSQPMTGTFYYNEIDQKLYLRTPNNWKTIAFE